MAAFLNRLFANLSAYFPWNFSSFKRDYSGEDDEEINEVEATPQKKQKLNRGSFVPKILREVNAEPAVRPVPSRLKIGENYHSSLFPTKPSMRASWSGPFNVDDDDENDIPLENASSQKLPRGTKLNGIASIDLTNDDDDRGDNGPWRGSYGNLVRPSMRTTRGTQRRARPSSLSSSVPDCFILDDSNSRSSGELFFEDDESSGGFSEVEILKINYPVVDLTDQGSERSTPENMVPRVNLTERRRMKSSLPNRSSHCGSFALSRFTRGSLNGSTNSKSMASIDLTTDSNDSIRRRRNSSTRSLSTTNVSMVDLQECITYGRVLGSMLGGKMKIPQRPSPPNLSGTIDLTNDEEEPPSSPVANNSLRDKSLRLPVIEKTSEPSSASISTSTQEEMKKEIMRVNSFSEKIKDVPCTQDEWVEKLLKDYEETQKEFKNTRDRFMREAIKWSQVNHRDVEALLEEKLNRHLQITEASLPEVKEDYQPIIKPLPDLTPEMEAKVRSAFSRSSDNPVLISKFNLNITKKDIQTLNNLNWLNDEVINFYMQLLEERCKENEKYPLVHTFNTFFYTGLSKRGHDGMKRWTKKVNIFEKDIIIIPVHLHVHWCSAVVDLKKKEINYYDSMGNDNNACLQHISKYLKAEHQVKMESELDLSDWKIRNVKNIPQQMNGSDCGVFACTYAEFSARRAPFTFDQSKMPYFRRKMAYEILTGQLLL